LGRGKNRNGIRTLSYPPKHTKGYASRNKSGNFRREPVIKGTRITVEFILDLLANGWSYEDILDAIEYAAEVLKEERVHILPKKYEVHN